MRQDSPCISRCHVRATDRYTAGCRIDRKSSLLRSSSLALVVAVLILSGGCGVPAASPTPAPEPLPAEISLYNWVGYMPQAVLDAFYDEYGVRVNYVTYATQEEAAERIEAGDAYDVVVMGNEFIPALLAGDLLAEIDYRHVPNFRNIAADFRDLIYDPGNEHTVPFLWGTTGLLVRTDLVERPITRWADLWDPAFAGKVAVWETKDPLLLVALKVEGYSVNSQEPAELDAALDRVMALRPHVLLWPSDEASIVPPLLTGEAVIAIGWAYDGVTARDANPAIEYVLPEEGTLLWNDNLAICANSQHKAAAELFVNFVLRPDIGAEIVNELYYGSANEAVTPFLTDEVASDPLVFPPAESLRNAEVILPRTAEGEALLNQAWERFMAGEP